MTAGYVFHLSIPVADLAAARQFYVGVMGATTGRQSETWQDVLLWGHQITLQHQPAEVRPLAEQGTRHFGVSLPWDLWEREAARIRAMGVPFLREPIVLHGGTRDEQGKFYLADPSHNVIEVKAYRDAGHVLRLSPPASGDGGR